MRQLKHMVRMRHEPSLGLFMLGFPLCRSFDFFVGMSKEGLTEVPPHEISHHAIASFVAAVPKNAQERARCVTDSPYCASLVHVKRPGAVPSKSRPAQPSSLRSAI